MEKLMKQQQHDHHLLQESMERCLRMETACLSLTKQLTTQGFRLRHMQAMVIKEQQRNTILNDKTNHHRMCHVSTQCVDVIEQRNTTAADVDTVAATTTAVTEDGTGQYDVHVPSPTSSSIPNKKKVVVAGNQSNHKGINNERDVAGKGKQTRTYSKVLTMTGFAKVSVPISPRKQPQQVQPPCDKAASQSPQKKKKRTSGSSNGVQQHWKNDDDNHRADDNNSETAVSCRAGEIRSRPTTTSSSISSNSMISNVKYVNGDSHSQSQYTSNPTDKHRVVVVTTTAAVRRRPPGPTTTSTEEGRLGFPQRRQPLDDIENNIMNTIGSTRAIHSLPPSELQTTIRKIPSRQTIRSSSTTAKSIGQPLPLHGSRVVMFDGDYDAQLFALLDDIEEQI
jgi:hypothetical protein